MELEDELTDWMGTEAALVFTAGYLANMGLLSTLVEADDAVFLDSAGHASLIDGARLCNGVLRSFRHNLPSSLHQRLKTWRPPPRRPPPPPIRITARSRRRSSSPSPPGSARCRRRWPRRPAPTSASTRWSAS